jgi:hypothetical protein
MIHHVPDQWLTSFIAFTSDTPNSCRRASCRCLEQVCEVALGIGVTSLHLRPVNLPPFFGTPHQRRIQLHRDGRVRMSRTHPNLTR